VIILLYGTAQLRFIQRLAQPLLELGVEVGNSKLPFTRHVLAEQRTPNKKTLHATV
jgi:hypothetical protein